MVSGFASAPPSSSASVAVLEPGNLGSSVVSENLAIDSKTRGLLDKLLPYAVSSNVFLEEVPFEFSEFMSLELPVSDAVTVKSTVQVKGVNRFLSAVFVNEESVRLQKNGQFFTELALSEFGYQPIYVSFLTADNRFFTIERSVVRLKMPPDIDQYLSKRREYVYFYNTPFLYNPHRNRLLGGAFTRADLAYFIFILKGSDVVSGSFSKFGDVSKHDWYHEAVQYAIDSQFMSEFPDGLFKPDRQVTKLEYLLTLVRALKLPFEEIYVDLPFKDVDAKHWVSKFIQAAFNEGLIEPDVHIQLNQALMLSDFIELAQLIPQVQLAYNYLADTDKESKEVELAYLEPVHEELERQALRLKTLKQVTFESPQPLHFFVGEEILIEGQLYPPTSFSFADHLILPDFLGRFSEKVPFSVAKHVVTLNVLEQEFSFMLVGLESYQDLDGHWIQLEAAQSRYIGLTAPTENFYPKLELVRKDFARYLSLLYDLEPSENVTSNIFDVYEDDADYESIQAVVHNEVLSLIEGSFMPDMAVRKIDALATIMKLESLYDDSDLNTDSFPFWDISEKHWGRAAVEKALSLGLISGASQFYPNKTLSKAELIAILAKTNAFESKLSTMVLHD